MTNSNIKRKPNSIFDEQVKAINSYNIGDIYKVSDMRKRMKVGSYNTERVGDYHLDLLSTNCIKRVKRGYYQVIGHIPDFVTLNMCEANRGYTTYGPNPKYVGKSDKFGKEGCYKEWYINGEQPRIEVPRGKTWKLGEPNPYDTNITMSPEYWKRFEENNQLIEKILNESKEKRFGSAQTEVAQRIERIINEGKTVEARHKITLAVFVIISIDGSFANVRYIDSDKIEVIALINIVDVRIKDAEPQLTVENKRDQIINILKQGLSAADAADKILTLF